MGMARASILAVWLSCVGACGGSDPADGAGDGLDGAADAATDVGAGDAGPNCGDQTRAAALLVSAGAEAARADLSCQADEDCVVVWTTTDCSDTCSVLVSRAGAEKVQAAIDEANATVCLGFSDAGCRIVRPPCAPPPRWACLSGTCGVITE
jgi:acyl-CoA reductase-like NAD-dependent aldehyde dehydrogenase